jgi:WhiB family redox-sensing transcriptional regulator
MSILDIRTPGFFEDAACQGADLVLFFPESTNNQCHEARAICGRCDVQERCLTWAMEIEAQHPGSRHGIYGGLGPKQRAKLGKKAS